MRRRTRREGDPGSSTRLAARYIDDEGALILSDTAAWAYFRVPLVHYELLPDAAREQLVLRATGALSGFYDVQAHLLVVHRELAETVPAWAQQLHERAYAPTDGWPDRLAVEQTRLYAQDLWPKEVYLGIRLGPRGGGLTQGPLALLRSAEQNLGLEDHAVTPAEIVEWRRQAGTVARSLASGALNAEPATPDELAWLIQRAVHGPLPIPARPPARQAWGAGDLVGLVEGRVLWRDRENRLRPHGLTIVHEHGTALISYLAMSRFPSNLVVPGGEWLYLPEQPAIGFPVDISARMELVSPATAKRHVARKLADAQDQASHYTEGGGAVGLELQEKLEVAEQLKYAIAKERLPFVYDRVRLTVATAAARSPGEAAAAHDANLAVAHAELDRRVQAVKDRYHDDLSIVVQRPYGDQLRLLLETMPADRVRDSAYVQRRSLLTVVGGMAVASGRVGEPVRRDRAQLAGPYIGMNRGDERSPVHYDLTTAARLNMETAVAYTGTLGSGKTNGVMLHTLQALDRGAVVFSLDPKGDFARCLARVPGIGPVEVLNLLDGAPGLLDPFALAPDPSTRKLYAIESLLLLLPPRLDAAREAAIYAAVKATMAGEEAGHGAASLWRVVRELERAGHHDPAARSLALQLEMMADLPVARLLFAPANTQRPFAALKGLTVVNLRGLIHAFPKPGVDRQYYTVEQRLTQAAFWAVSVKGRQLLHGLGVRRPKVLAIDEAWMLTSTPQGEKLVMETARTGRSLNIAVPLSSQNAGDLLGEEVTNCISAVFAFRSTDETELGNVLRLLRLADTERHRQRIMALPTGHCLFRDLDGRVAPMEIDLGSDELRALFDTNPNRAPDPEETEETEETLAAAVGAEAMSRPDTAAAAASTFQVIGRDGEPREPHDPHEPREWGGSRP